jgi:hypothetical protein
MQTRDRVPGCTYHRCVQALLVRVGIDQAFGGWNAPIDPATCEFAYVPIPDRDLRPHLSTPYTAIAGVLAAFASARVVDDKACTLPTALDKQMMHLDPDFRWLTYGDTERRGKGLAEFSSGDIVVFYAGLRPCRLGGKRSKTLVYALIGLYEVGEVVRLGAVEESRWQENAHTRRVNHDPDDVIVRATSGTSGRLRRCLPVGGWRDGAYRVFPELLAAWGGLSCKDGFLQRSAVPPTFLDPARFLSWFEAQKTELVQDNN